MGWKLSGFPSEWTRTVWKGCEAYRGTKCWRAMAKGSRGVCPSLLTLLDGRAAVICGLHRGASGLRRTAKNVCRCNLVHSRQTHAVTFWLCSSIVVAIFVTFWNDSLLRIKTLIINMLFPACGLWLKIWSPCYGRFNPGAKAPPVWSVSAKECAVQPQKPPPPSLVYLSLPSCLQPFLNAGPLSPQRLSVMSYVVIVQNVRSPRPVCDAY